jgi:thymidine phosphorylase
LVALQGGQLLALTGGSVTLEHGMNMIHEVLENGEALRIFTEMCVQQGTRRSVAEELAIHPEHILPQSKKITTLYSPKSGYVESIDAMTLAEVARELGAGRFTMSDSINHGIGYVLETAKTHPIQKDEPWITIHHDLDLSSEHLNRLRDCLKIDDQTSGDFQRLITIIT